MKHSNAHQLRIVFLTLRTHNTYVPSFLVHRCSVYLYFYCSLDARSHNSHDSTWIIFKPPVHQYINGTMYEWSTRKYTRSHSHSHTKLLRRRKNKSISFLCVKIDVIISQTDIIHRKTRFFYHRDSELNFRFLDNQFFA